MHMHMYVHNETSKVQCATPLEQFQVTSKKKNLTIQILKLLQLATC